MPHAASSRVMRSGSLARRLQVAHVNDDKISLKSWFDSLPKNQRDDLDEAFTLIPDSDLVQLDAFRSWLPDTTKYLFHRDD